MAHPLLRGVLGVCAISMFAASGCSSRESPVTAEAAPPEVRVDSVASSPPAPPAQGWSAATPIGRIVAERPGTARVFERVGIDYCCGGATPLGDAVSAKGGGLEATELLAELAAVREGPQAGAGRSWIDAPLHEVLDHIEKTHHVYLREELPRLSALVDKVRAVHEAHHPELVEVAALYATLARELPPHLELEERRLFPAITAAEAGKAALPADVLSELALMESQHEGAGAALHRLREVTKGYEPPADACAAYKQMLTGLAALEKDLHAHVHLENNVVAPRARALAKG